MDASSSLSQFSTTPSPSVKSAKNPIDMLLGIADKRLYITTVQFQIIEKQILRLSENDCDKSIIEPAIHKWLYFEPIGVVLVYCLNDLTKIWLKNEVDRLSTTLWEGAQLEVISRDQLKLTQVYVAVTEPKENIKLIIHRLTILNEWANIPEWTLLNDRFDGWEHQMVFALSQHRIKTLKEHKYKLKYRVGYADVWVRSILKLPE